MGTGRLKSYGRNLTSLGLDTKDLIKRERGKNDLDKLI